MSRAPTVDMTKYVRQKLLGKGAMGEVYSARRESGEEVAVKNVRRTLAMDPAMVKRFINESRLLGRVMHHNVVRAVESGVDPDGQPRLVMNYVAGVTLRELIVNEGALRVERAFGIAAQLLTGLAAIHEARVVHADIKSSNVLIGDQDRVTIIDFGLARTLSRELAPDSELAGTPSFMAPEVILGGAPSITSDLYAVGAILYEMLTGVTPFASSIDMFDAHVNERVIPPSVRAPDRNLSAAIDRVVLRALEKSPAARFQSARDFATVLDAALMGEALNATVHLARADVTANPDDDLTVRWRRERATLTEITPMVTLVEEMILGTLERAGRLIDGHDLRAAVIELESGLDKLIEDPRLSSALDREAWRIETVLAALHASLGRKQLALEIALAAQQRAIALDCKIAVGRTTSLVERLEADKPRPRLARGSGRFTRRP
jgi:serine/threonine protein kinase